MTTDLFDTEEDQATLAQKKLPRVAKATGKCAADYATPKERQQFSERLQRRSENLMERDRIMAARAWVKQQKKRKNRTP